MKTQDSSPSLTLSPLERLALTRVFPSAVSSVVLVLLLAAALHWLIHRPLFQIQHIHIEGELEHTELEQIQHNTPAFFSLQNFWLMDLQQAQALFMQEPWVRKAVIKRQFPNTLRVLIEEHQASAIWHSEQGQRYINFDGEIFEASTSPNHDRLPLFKGEDSRARHIMNTYIVLNRLLQKHQLEIQEIELTQGGLWRINLDSGTRVELGRGDEYALSERLSHFFDALGQIYAQQSAKQTLQMLAYADLRYQRGFSIRKRVAASHVGVE